jgi:hypothetical protein
MDVQYCVVQNGMLSNQTVTVNTTTNDTTFNGTAISTAFPATTGYAAGATWYINNEPITIDGHRYLKLGLPRVLGVTDVTASGTYQGVPVFVENGAATTGNGPDIVYLPVRPGCEFQPYQREQIIKRVRG